MKTREELLKTPRMFNYPHMGGPTSCKGLFDLIDDHITPASIIIEIGSFAGVSTECFAKHCARIYCIDTWAPNYEYHDHTIQHAETQFDQLTKEYNNIIKIKAKSAQATYLFTTSKVDLIYIDADHSYESVKQDIQNWIPKLKPGGILSGHDYHIPSVQTAVRLFANPKIYDDCSWAFRI